MSIGEKILAVAKAANMKDELVESYSLYRAPWRLDPESFGCFEGPILDFIMNVRMYGDDTPWTQSQYEEMHEKSLSGTSGGTKYALNFLDLLYESIPGDES